jgi:predicted transcriptional regulator
MSQQLVQPRQIDFLGIPQLSGGPTAPEFPVPSTSSASLSSNSYSGPGASFPPASHYRSPLKFPPLPSGPRRSRKAVRSQDKIVAAILDACRTPTVQHWIMVKARLGYDTFWKHMNHLLSMGVMDETIEGSKTFYRINASGLALLDQLASK